MRTRFMILNSADPLLTSGGGSGGATNTQQTTQQTTNQQTAPQVVFPDNWKAGLGDLANDPSLGAINDIPSLAKSFIHAQKMVGKDKIVIPDKFATPEDWKNNVWKKLGLPESADKYEFKAPEGADPAFISKFKEFALQKGILPNQAEALFDFYSGYTKEVMGTQEAENKRLFEESASKLKQEFGAAYEKKLGVASGLFNQIADDDLKNLFKETGLGNNPLVIKMFAKMAEQLGEDKFVPAALKGNMGVTPDEAQTKINEILGNSAHPYFNKDHPSHKAAVDEMGRLFAMTTAQAN